MYRVNYIHNRKSTEWEIYRVQREKAWLHEFWLTKNVFWFPLLKQNWHKLRFNDCSENFWDPRKSELTYNGSGGKKLSKFYWWWWWFPLTLVHVGEGRRGRSMKEFEGNTDYGAMVQPSQHHVATCIKGVEWGLGKKMIDQCSDSGSLCWLLRKLHWQEFYNLIW